LILTVLSRMVAQVYGPIIMAIGLESGPEASFVSDGE